MKKYIALLLALVMVLSLTACTQAQPVPTNDTTPSSPPTSAPTEPEHIHSYTQTVTAPDCINGGYTTNACECGDEYISDNVDALGHNWSDATCTAPKTCSVCAITEGELAAHNYQNGSCSVCGEKDPSFKALNKGNWICTKLVNDNMVEQKLCFNANSDMGFAAWSVRYFENIGPEADPDFMDYLIAEGKLIKHKGNYYQHMGMGDMGEISFTEKGNTITVTMLYWDASIVLERIAGDQLKVISVKGNATSAIGSLKAGEIFTWSK